MRTQIRNVERIVKRGLTVAELLDVLEGCDPAARVVFACDYGDISHTLQALPVRSAEEFEPDFQRLEESAYSQSGLAIADREPSTEDDRDDDRDEQEDFAVVILQ
jgi:hypothetical protein